MTQAGFPVPNGFVLTTKTFWLNSHERDDEVLHAFDQLDCKFVAVRSSGTKEDGIDDSFAGQFDTYLFVTKEKLIEQIIECHDSINSERIISYCESKNINRKDIKVAVVVQKMINSDVAWVCFTINPVSGETDEVMIEAGYGVWEAVVSGMITPDNYIIDKITGTIQKTISEQTKKLVLDIEQWWTKEEQIESTIMSSQKLSDNHILELAEYAKNIENHYGKPMDTEWAVEDGKLYILQARPVTTFFSDNRQKFQKTYTRDTTLIIQQAWHNVFIEWFNNEWIISNYSVPVVHYMHWWTIEIRENESCTHYYLEELLKKHNLWIDFYNHIVNKYLSFLEICKIRREEWYTKDINELKKFIQRIFDEMKWFVVFYYAWYDERVPCKIRENALEIRDSDSFFASNDKYIRKSLINIYPELNWYESCILWQEIENPPSLDELKKRSNSCIIQGTKYHANINIEKYASDHPEFYFNIEKPLNTQHIKWQIAFPGMKRGKVFILLRNNQIHDVKEWDIVVAPMTTPEHLPAMKKAWAFVTDEWWITCHAAIVARELKKPCIIWTKFATQLLKNWDEVDVDADFWVIYIIKN